MSEIKNDVREAVIAKWLSLENEGKRDEASELLAKINRHNLQRTWTLIKSEPEVVRDQT